MGLGGLGETGWGESLNRIELCELAVRVYGSKTEKSYIRVYIWTCVLFLWFYSMNVCHVPRKDLLSWNFDQSAPVPSSVRICNQGIKALLHPLLRVHQNSALLWKRPYMDIAPVHRFYLACNASKVQLVSF
jgi:hypothetical protein